MDNLCSCDAYCSLINAMVKRNRYEFFDTYFSAYGHAIRRGVIDFMCNSCFIQQLKRVVHLPGICIRIGVRMHELHAGLKSNGAKHFAQSYRRQLQPQTS